MVILLFFLLTMIGGASMDRLRCLQFEQGKEDHRTPWRRDFVSHDPQYQKNQSWIYSNEQCPLHQFSEEAFCTRAVQCGKYLLLVGDSTIANVARVLSQLVSGKERLYRCLTHNFCVDGHPNPESSSTCQMHGRVERSRGNELCDKYCPPEKLVRVTFVRHDYLTHIHGETNYWSNICEHWKSVARRADYILISAGPHVHDMLTFPFGRPPPAGFNETAFFEQEAADTTALLKAITKPSATVIYRTGMVGVAEPSADCSLRPSDSPPAIASMYSWDKIPLLNAAYIRHLQGGLGLRQRGNNNSSDLSAGPGTGAEIAEEGRSVLVMDTTTLMSKIYGCRIDYLHFSVEEPNTPLLLEWLVLYNLLLEHNRADSGTTHQ